jgi:hypothetical protein
VWPPQWWCTALCWWDGQDKLIKIGLVGIALLLLSLAGRLQALGSPAVVGFVRAILWGIVLGGVADLTRPFWEPQWFALSSSSHQIDLALVLLFLPLGWWSFGFVLAVAGIGVALALLAVMLLFTLAYFTWLLELLQRL